jgi:hypothetical protein
MSSANPRTGYTTRMFPPTLIAPIRNGGAPDLAAVLPTARHFKRDLTTTDAACLPRRMAVRLDYLAVTGEQIRELRRG